MALFLITGGAGFIGSHTALVLLEAGHSLVVLDNYHNSTPHSLQRVLDLAGSAARSRLVVVKGDIRSDTDLRRAFLASPAGQSIDAVIHFAGLKAVSDSVRDPLAYWDVNVSGSCKLLKAMRSFCCRTLVFSSSATVYGMPDVVPIPETAPLQPINPYGTTKISVEHLLTELFASESGWRIALLRYFNPVGAHPSGYIGEDPRGVPSNLFPIVAQVAAGQRASLQIFGDDWPTPDGSGVRDFIHVMDLAEGHQSALSSLLEGESQLITVNLGSGQGHSVFDVVTAFEAASGCKIPIEIADRREGDAAISVADAALAAARLKWCTKRTLADMCIDSWTWKKLNPNGFSL